MFALKEDGLFQGYGGNAFGPGYYTSKNPSVIFGTDKTPGYYENSDQTIRKQKLPKGTKIFDYHKVPADIAENIFRKVFDASEVNINRLRDLHEKDGYYDFNNDQFMRHYGEELNNVLLKMGYDAIEYKPFTTTRRFDLDPNERKKFIEKHTKYGNNILIINPALLIDTKLFEMERLHPERFTKDNFNSLPESVKQRVLNRDSILAKQNSLIKFLEGNTDYYDFPEQIRPSTKDILNVFYAYSQKNLEGQLIDMIPYEYLPKEIREDTSINGWPYRKMLRDGEIYSELPKKLKLLPRFIIMGLDNTDGSGDFVKEIPEEFWINIENVRDVLLEIPSLYRYIPEQYKNNPEYRDQILHENGEIFEYADQEGHLTEDHIRKYKPSSSYDLQNIPERFFNDDYVHSLIRQNPLNYTFIPFQYKTLENLAKAISQNPMLWWRFNLDPTKNPELVKRFMSAYPDLYQEVKNTYPELTRKDAEALENNSSDQTNQTQSVTAFNLARFKR